MKYRVSKFSLSFRNTHLSLMHKSHLLVVLVTIWLGTSSPNKGTFAKEWKKLFVRKMSKASHPENASDICI